MFIFIGKGSLAGMRGSELGGLLPTYTKLDGLLSAKV
jgi:hypothetical protein